MKSKPIALLPCWLLLVAVGCLVERCHRADWRQEWLAELWYRLQTLRMRDEWNARNALRLYRSALHGCVHDAWYLLRTNESRWEAMYTQVRSPGTCAAGLLFALLLVGVGSGSFPATRTILGTLPYADASRIALISRTGRLEAIRRGIPPELSYYWRHDTKLVQAMAGCTLVRETPAIIGSQVAQASALQATPNLFNVLGITNSSEPGTALLAYSFWQRQLNSDPGVIGQTIRHNNRSYRVSGVLPPEFWFITPTVQIYEFDDDIKRLLIVRTRPSVTPNQLESELSDVAERHEMPFLQTAPHALFLADAVHTPIMLFGSALLISLVLFLVAHGFHLGSAERPDTRVPRGNWIWWLFLAAKTILGLLLVFTTGIEIFIGFSHQFTTEPLGGPALLWFYIAACSGIFFAVSRDQQARCRVCLQGLAFPIRIGCPGCVFLGWSGTELLCPEGHGVLYVPHHLCCWDEAERWVALEI